MWYDAIFLKYRTILNELSPQVQRARLAFRGMTVSDDAANDRTLVYPGGGAGTNLTDASVTITFAQGAWRTLPASTLSTDRTVRVSASGALTGDQITLTRLDVSAHTLDIVDDSSSARIALLNTPGSGGSTQAQTVLIEFNGTAWVLRMGGTVGLS